ncbi:unnamed protein product [Rhizoctonia solani]|uniref:RlpA-like protein double-psi beta-barrel domain-containing protein n=1 Tax=Rhizoctonia solani TaxID=456999 RepID=A0A8H3AV92_9AGAM|nr:unnamed protein product [Rhizoctonia solani]
MRNDPGRQHGLCFFRHIKGGVVRLDLYFLFLPLPLLLDPSRLEVCFLLCHCPCCSSHSHSALKMFRFSFFTTVLIFVMALITFAAPIQPADLELAKVPVDFTADVPAELESRQETHTLEKRRTGKATWFNTGLGACGKVTNDKQFIVALGPGAYQNGKMCGKTITIKNTKNKNFVTAKVVDLCPSCGSNNLDLSPAAFAKLGSLSAGVLSVSWN